MPQNFYIQGCFSLLCLCFKIPCLRKLCKMKVSKSGVVETKDKCLKACNEMSSGGSSYFILKI